MQRTGIFEIMLSTAVILLAVGFLGFIFWQTSTGSLNSYDMSVRLKSADGLKRGSDVKIAGVKMGTIEDLTLHTKPYAVDLKLAIRGDIPIPEDSSLSIGSDILSSAWLSIKPGRSKAMVPPGGTLKAR